MVGELIEQKDEVNERRRFETVIIGCCNSVSFKIDLNVKL